MVWDATMPGVQTNIPDVILPPKTLIDGAATGGFHETCDFDTDVNGFTKRLPPGQSTDFWHATMWTRAIKSVRTQATCDMLEE